MDRVIIIAGTDNPTRTEPEVVSPKKLPTRQVMRNPVLKDLGDKFIDEEKEDGDVYHNYERMFQTRLE